jgi:acetolactate synthase-1/3 small subunit
MPRSENHTIVALVEDKPGVLNRIASKWRQRGFNIESLAVGHSEVPGLSRMTFTVDGARHDIEQVTKQLYKVIEVVKISDITGEDIVARELAMIKVAANAQTRSAIIEISTLFRANIIDVSPDSLIVEVTGTEDKVEAIYELLQPYGIKELVRTGRIAMSRGGGASVTVNGGGGASAGTHDRYRSAGEGKPQVGSLL